MVLELLAVAAAVCCLVAVYRNRPVGPVLRYLPPEDWPPESADEPLPRGRDLRRYVGRGLSDIDDYLADRERP